MSDDSIILNRLRKNLKNRKNLVKTEKTTAFRLYEKDIPEYPYIIDCYNDFVVVYEKGKNIKEDDLEIQQKRQMHIEEVKKALTNLLSPKEIILKLREKKKGKNQYETIDKKQNFFTVNENDMNFIVNLHDYLDTGLFLDHRPLRKMIKNSSLSKNVLNLFSYTGSISVAAARGGGKVTTVDMSKTYIDWAQDNFWENQLDPEMHSFIQADATKYIQELKSQYDIIILDPPSFSNSKRMDDIFDVQRDHLSMVETLMNHLKPDGVLYFSNNFRKFKLDSKLTETFKVKDITFKTIPKDFKDQKIHICFEIRHKN